MRRASSSTWSVYDSAWPLAEKPSASPPIPFVDGPPDTLSLKGCGLVRDALLQQGAQGAVYAAHEARNSNDDCAAIAPRRYAVKRLFSQPNDFGRRGIEETVLREATVLRHANHQSQLRRNKPPQPMTTSSSSGDEQSVFTYGQDDSVGVIRLYRVVEAPHNELCLVMELCASDLRRQTMVRRHGGGGSADHTVPNPSVLRYLLRRMLSVVRFLHEDCRILHRDIKLSNFLVLPDGELRLTDFGSARFLSNGGTTTTVTDGANALTRPHVAYSPASTRTTMLYQPPETLMGSQEYGMALDVWGLGVVFAELILQKHLFSAEGELALLSAIWKLLGSPTSDGADASVEAAKPTFDIKFSPAVISADGADLLRRMLTITPERRITTQEALRHPFLRYKGAAEDDAEGARLWQEKVRHALEQRAEKATVRMPRLSLGLAEDESEDDVEGSGRQIPGLGKLTPPNFTLELF